MASKEIGLFFDPPLKTENYCYFVEASKQCLPSRMLLMLHRGSILFAQNIPFPLEVNTVLFMYDANAWQFSINRTNSYNLQQCCAVLMN